MTHIGSPIQSLLERHQAVSDNYSQTRQAQASKQYWLDFNLLYAQHRLLLDHVKPVLLNAQQMLQQAGYSSGVKELKIERPANPPHPGWHDWPEQLLSRLEFYFSARPTNVGAEVSEQTSGTNVLSFLGVKERPDIACQFQTRLVQSKELMLFLEDDDQPIQNQQNNSPYQFGNKEEVSAQHWGWWPGHPPMPPQAPSFVNSELHNQLFDFINLVLISERNSLSSINFS